jgi:hypothetical protein
MIAKQYSTTDINSLRIRGVNSLDDVPTFCFLLFHVSRPSAGSGGLLAFALKG